MKVAVEGLEQLLRKQSEVLTREQALAAGFSRDEIRHRLAEGPWQRLYPGVYLLHAFPPTHEQWCQAALLHAGDDARIWGSSAARLHGLWGFTPKADQVDEPELPISIGVPHTRRVAPTENLSVVRCRAFEPVDLADVSGLPSVNSARALIEAGAEATQRQLAMAVEHLRKQGKIGWLRKRLGELRHGRDGLEPLAELVHRYPGGVTAVDSPLEAWCADVMYRHKLHPERQWAIEFRDKRAVLDFAFLEEGLAVETDGRHVHERDPFFNSDRARWAWIENAGWSHLKFTWAQLHDEHYVVTTINDRLQMLRQRGQSVGLY